MALFWMEDVCDRVIAVIQANIAGKLATIYAEYQDDNTQIPTPRTDAYFIAEPDLTMVPETPACFVIGEQAEATGWHNTMGTLTTKFRVSVIWLIDGDSPRVVRKKLNRLTRATVEILLANPTLNLFQLGGGDPPRADWSTTWAKGDGATYLAGCRVQLTYTKREQFTEP